MPAMTALKPSPPSLRPPFPTPRCAWSHPELGSHSLLALTQTELYLVPYTGDSHPELVAAAETETELSGLLGPQVPPIDLTTIRRVKLDLLQNSLDITLADGRINLRFTTSKDADACFTQLWQRLGAQARLESSQGTWWARARLPMTVLGAILAITAALALSISVVDSLPDTGEAASLTVPGGPVNVPESVHGLIGWMDWRAVCVLGGIGAAAAQVWLYRQVTQPPVSLELFRAETELEGRWCGKVGT